MKIDLTFSQIKDMGHSKEESTIPTKIGRQHDLYTLMSKAVLHNLKQSVLSTSLKKHSWILFLELKMTDTFLNVIPKCPSIELEVVCGCNGFTF